MHRRRAVLLSGIVLAMLGATELAGPTDSGPSAESLARAASEARIRDLDIAFYEARVAGSEFGARDRAQLASLYLRRARETGSHEDLLRAEELARASLAQRRAHNAASLAVLATSLASQHRFVEALDAAERLLAFDSASVGARAILGELQLELGRYADARRVFGTLAMRRTDPVVAPRYARWEELRGRPAEARRLLRDARATLRGLHEVPTEQLAWFQLRLGDLAMRHGRLGEAAEEFSAGLALAAEDHRLLGAMARLELVRGRPRRAIKYGELAVARALDPAVLGVLHEAHATLGDSTGAEQYDRALRVALLSQPGPLHRAWSMFLLDHGRDLETVLARAQHEISVRTDVYGWDLLAWALHRSGRHSEAHQAMTHALALGTRDAVLHYHAGRIALAVGDFAGTRWHLKQALAINPFWHHTQPAAARALLDSL